MIGDDRHGASQGPQRMLQAGAGELFTARNIAASVERVERGAPFRDSTSASLAVNKSLSATVQRVTSGGALPVVLAGSCDASLGILAGFEHARCGIVWVDAHGDFNTPESTVSGFLAGMSLAVVTGHCYRNYWGQMGDNTPVSEAATLLIGVRDLDPGERQRLESSEVQLVRWEEGRAQADVNATLEVLANRVQATYLHIDMDAMDPEIAPGIVDHPVPGGLSLAQLEEIIRAVCSRFRVKAACLATYTPERDVGDKTLQVGLRILETLAECSRSGIAELDEGPL
jgi:arginase